MVRLALSFCVSVPNSLCCHTNYVPLDGDKKVPVVRILVNAGEGNPLEKWSAARRDITALLDDHGFDDLDVEIQDLNRFYQPSLFPIHPSHPAVTIYKSVREDLLVRISNSIGSVWNFLSLFEVGRSANLGEPAIVLMVDPLAERDWSILKASLEAVINNRQDMRGRSLPVEIMPGGWADVPHDQQSRPGLSFLDDFEGHPRSGTSIGVRGEIGCGTLGGYFHLKSPKKIHKGFLASSHAVAPASSAPSTAILEYDLLGLAYTASDNAAGRTWIHYFAQKDVDATRTNAEERLQTLKTEVTAINERLKRHEERGESASGRSAGIKEMRTDFMQHIRLTEQALLTVKTIPKLYGRTIVASGRRLTPQMKTLDYAFVETSSTDTNQVPPESSFTDIKGRPIDLGISKQELMLPSTYRSFTNIEAGRWYYKVGRTTRLTSGICNGVEAWVRPSGQHTLFNARGAVVSVRRFGKKLQVNEETGRLIYDEKGKPKESEDPNDVYYASEWVIVNATVDGSSIGKQREFCDLGDSGSLILDQYARVAGILWGSVTGYCGPEGEGTVYSSAGLVSDIDDVEASLKVQLGWPQNADVNCLQLP